MEKLDNLLQKLIDYTLENNDLLGLLLQGSYVNKKQTLDDFSDLDPLFITTDVEKYQNNKEWIKDFGTPLAMFEDTEVIHNEVSYTILILFKEGFRIDFTFAPVSHIKQLEELPLYKVYVDKNNLFQKQSHLEDENFYPKKPTNEEFTLNINNFLWDITYIIKSLCREEHYFTMYMFSVLHENLFHTINAYIGSSCDFNFNPGVMGKWFKKYLTNEEYTLLLKTYPKGTNEEIIRAMYKLLDAVFYFGTKAAKNLNYVFPHDTYNDVLNYTKQKEQIYIKKTAN